MEMCRACLIINNNMIPIDDTFILHFNLLTDLNVAFSDGFPQYSCQQCFKVLENFIEFRTKAIASDRTFRELVENIKPETTTLNIKPDANNDGSIKIEIKPEFSTVPDAIDDYVGDCQYEDNLLQINYTMDFIENKNTKKAKIKTENTCSENKYKGPKKKKLKKNIDADDVNNFWSCGLCQKTFVDKTLLKTHIETHKQHTQCELCQESCRSWQQLLAHRVAHLPVKQRRCHLCDKYFASIYGLEYHYLCAHSDVQDKSLQCKICSKSYDHPEKIRKHYINVHPKSKSVYICDYCSKRCNSKQNLRCHIASHLEIKPFQCNFCTFSCKIKHGLKDHIIRKHEPNKVTCRNCKRIFKNQEYHDKHKCNEEKYICPICGKRIERNARVSRHMATHAPEGRFACARCPRVFRAPQALRDHTSRHAGAPAYRCGQCPAVFYTASSRIRHRRLHTGERPYVCKICSKAFTSNSGLKTHMRVHGLFLVNHRNKDPENNTELK